MGTGAGAAEKEYAVKIWQRVYLNKMSRTDMSEVCRLPPP